jgi:hypothetical protein
MKNSEKILFFTAIFIFMYALCLMNNYVDRDLWHRLAVGEIFWQIGTVLKHDIFAYTPVKYLWVDHEWGSGVIFYSLAKLSGDFGLMMLKIISFFTVFMLIYLVNNYKKSKEDDKFKIFFYIISVLAVFIGFQSSVRSQIFTYLFFTLFIFLLEKIRNDKDNSIRHNLKTIFIFPLIMLLWTNLHGGFVAGLGLIGIYIAGEFLNKKNPLIYIAIFLLSLSMTLINPYGINFIEYMFTAATMPRPYIIEWKPLNLFENFWSHLGFKLLLIIIFFGWLHKLISKIKSIDWTELFLLLITLYLSLKHQRHVVFFAIAASIFGYQYFYNASIFCTNFVKKVLQKILSYKYLRLLSFAFQSFIYTFIITFGIYIILLNPMIIKIKPADYPANAVEFIKINKLNGNLLVPFNWGSYALWKLYPQCRVSIDSRYEETYSDSFYKEMMDFNFSNSGWDNVLKKYHADIILIPGDSKIYKKIYVLKNWKLIYYDKYSAVFINKTTSNKRWKNPEKNINYSKNKYIVPVRDYTIQKKSGVSS